MRIERIEKSKHKQERVLVFLEGGDLLRITGVELLRFGLHKDMELPEELVEELRRSAERSETKARAARLASSRMLSKKELSDRLVKKGTERGEAEELADWLEDLGAVDDAAYAGVIARHYGTMGYGPARVCQELRRRGIPCETGAGMLINQAAINIRLWTGLDPDKTVMYKALEEALR